GGGNYGCVGRGVWRTERVMPAAGVLASFRLWTMTLSFVTLLTVLATCREWRLSLWGDRVPRARTGQTATGISLSTTEGTSTPKRCVTSAGLVRAPRSAAGARAGSTAGAGGGGRGARAA